MNNDRKTSSLKALQGHIWKSGFLSGELKGQVYEDVTEAFKRWKANGKDIYIYSSGSVEAQKLLFRYSEKGDLTLYISGYFDTTTGPKRESQSYESIAAAVKVAPETILFLTDVPAEAYAAKEAGMQVCLIARPGNVPVSDEDKMLGVMDDFNGFE